MSATPQERENQPFLDNARSMVRTAHWVAAFCVAGAAASLIWGAPQWAGLQRGMLIGAGAFILHVLGWRLRSETVRIAGLVLMIGGAVWTTRGEGEKDYSLLGFCSVVGTCALLLWLLRPAVYRFARLEDTGPLASEKASAP